MQIFSLDKLVRLRMNKEIEAMLQKVDDPSKLVDDCGIPVLHLATQYNNLDLLKYLVNKGVDVNVKTWVGSTPLEIAVFYNQFEAMKILLKAGADIFGLDNNGRTTLEILKSKISQFPSNIVNCVINNYRKNELDSETKAIILSNTNCTLQFVLTLRDTVATTVYLDKNSNNMHQYDFDNALEFAMKQKDTENVRVILDYINKKSALSSIFFFWLDKFFNSVDHLNLKLAKLFLKKSIEWNMIDESSVRFYEHMFSLSNKDAIKVLLKSNVDLLIRNRFGFEILTHLFYNSEVDAIDLVRNRSFNVNGKNTFGDTALHLAVRIDLEKNIRCLLQMGADPNIKNNVGITPFYENINSGKIFYQELMLLHGADIQLDKANYAKFAHYNKRIPEYRMSLMTIIAQLAFDNARGIIIDNRYRNLINKSYRDFFEMCTYQIIQFKKHEISDSFTLFTLLKAKSEEIALRLRGEHYFSNLEDYCQERQVYPFYHTMLKFKLAKAYNIYFARRNFAEMFSQNTAIPVAFDNLVIDKIFSFLTYYDMLQLT